MKEEYKTPFLKGVIETLVVLGSPYNLIEKQIDDYNENFGRSINKIKYLDYQKKLYRFIIRSIPRASCPQLYLSAINEYRSAMRDAKEIKEEMVRLKALEEVDEKLFDEWISGDKIPTIDVDPVIDKKYRDYMLTLRELSTDNGQVNVVDSKNIKKKTEK